MRRVRDWAAALLLAAAGAGCGGPTAPVSGTVTLDNQPVEGASVTFTPEATKDGGIGGSYGKTDAQGRYSLKTVNGDRPGAAVGKHRVSISLTRGNPDNPESAQKEMIPARYNAKTELTFDVPPGGTDKADFSLTK